MQKIYFLLIALFLLSCFGLTLTEKIYAQYSPETPRSGKELFIKNRCVNCHTIGRGRFVGPDLKGVRSKYSRDEIKQWIENSQSIYQSKGRMPINEGYPPMPPLNVSPQEAETIADYLHSVEKLPLSKSEGGIIKGKIVNKSTEDAAENIEVNLTSYLGDRPTEERKTRTDKEGVFGFDNLPWNRSYTISLNYKGTEYITEKMVFYPDEDTKVLDLPIYEPTDSDKDISISAGHMIIEVSKDSISVVELMVFHNGSKSFYVGTRDLEDGRRETLRFSLPPGASDVRFLYGLTNESVVMKTEGGFVDTNGLQPGIRRVVYSYTLPYKSGVNILEKTVDYPTEEFLLLVSDSGAKIKVDGLRRGDAVQIDDDRFLRWTGKGLTPRTKVRIELSKPYLSEDSLKWIAFGIVLMSVVGAILYSFTKKRTNVVKNKASSTMDLEKERENLILEIADLDNRFQAKEITEEEYREVRSKKKDKLIEVIRKIKKRG